MKKLILIDGNSLMFKAYYATLGRDSHIMQNSKGIYTNAIFGFVNMLEHLLKSEYDNILVAFDAGKKTFRHEMMPEYKGTRSPMPDEFRSQIPYIRDYLVRRNIKYYELPLYEADDIIGTFARIGEENGYNVDIYSSDKDLLQLISDKTTVCMTRKGMSELEKFDPAHFTEVYGLNYTQMVDLKALMGDPSDNLKGIKGVGEKTAVKLLQEYGSLENIVQNKENIKGKLGEYIRDGFEDALMCKKMTIINRESPVTINLEDTEKKAMDPNKLKEFFVYLEFRGLLKNINDNYKEEVETKTEKVVEFEFIDSPYDLKDKLLPDSFLYFETDKYNYHQAKIISIGLANKKGTFVIDPSILFSSLDFQLFLEDDTPKNVFDLKRMKVMLKNLGFDLKGVKYDMMLASYLLRPEIKNNEMAICANQFDYVLKFKEEVFGKGKSFNIPKKEELGSFVASRVNAIKNLKMQFLEKLNSYQQLDLLNKVEIPLANVLAKMEFEGIKVDKEAVSLMKEKYSKEMASLEKNIHELVGHEFNIQSPSQLGTILFEELGLPVVKKTKTGYSTDVDVLNYLKDKHPIINLIMRYRQVTKLYQTYIEGLEGHIYPDGKIHTIFEQALTTTGRLSSIEPNVQNFPTRTSEGKLIRGFFVPNNPNDYLFSSDYSQVELRVLAHMSNCKLLLEAFNEGKDVHAETAKKIFKVEEVTDILRRRAKAVNFGIVYGISAFGLSDTSDLTIKEAQSFISAYFDLYPEVKEFMDQTVAFAKEHGYVLTLLNRRRYIPELNSSVFMQREFGKRTAMNAPIQGSAADIIKIAMVNIDKELEKRNLKSKMVLQIHDELVFDCASSEKQIIEQLVVKEMENAFKLNVRLDVDFGFGKNLMEVK